MSLYLIDPHPLMRDALARLLRRLRPDATLVPLARLAGLAEAIQQHGPPELFCLELKLPDTPGLSGIQEIKGLYPGVPLAVIAATPAEDVQAPCIEAGADIYLEKTTEAGEIATALSALLAPARPASPQPGKLPRRQKQLLALLDQGLSNRDIALQLGISEHTVKVHLCRLFRRLGTHSRSQTVHQARHSGWLDP